MADNRGEAQALKEAKTDLEQAIRSKESIIKDYQNKLQAQAADSHAARNTEILNMIAAACVIKDRDNALQVSVKFLLILTI